MYDIAHRRAAAAFDAVQSRFARWESLEDARPFRSVSLSAAVMLRQVGLLQLEAFWRTKDRAEPLVLEDLFRWLAGCPMTQMIFRATRERAAIEVTNPMKGLLLRTSDEISMLEAEGLAYLTWHKRFTEGSWQKMERGSQSAGNQVSDA